MGQVTDPCLIVNVVYFDLILLLLLEVVFHIDLGHPLWVEVIVDQLGLTNFGPEVPRLFVEN